MRAFSFFCGFVAVVATAQEHGIISASRSTGPIKVDGHLTDDAWQRAIPFTDFTESFPSPGAAPTMVTEARVLFDDHFIYVGVRCYDPQPQLIVRNLGRRDSTPTADLIEVAFNSSGDKRTAYSFSINAASVLRDRLFYGDTNSTDTWDATWDGAARIDSEGWTAEFAIPIRDLRISRSGAPWGFQIRRTVPRTHQIFDSRQIARQANPGTPGELAVSRFGVLTEIEELKPKRSGTIIIYAAPRGTLRPQYSSDATPWPRLFDPSLNIGADFNFAITNRLVLSATLNPDFGQVDADQIILNLSAAEYFYDEKRPFFLQGLDIFEPVGSEYGNHQRMFYSRRIGLNTPILAALKISGSLTNKLEVGLLDAVVLGAGNPKAQEVGFEDLSGDGLTAFERTPDRRLGYHWETPFRLGINDELPLRRPIPTNYLAAVARNRFTETIAVGATITAATPLAPRCTRADFTSDDAFATANCDPLGANALALDWNLRSKNGDWRFFGQIDGTQQVFGNSKGRRLADGTVMMPNDLGFGTRMRAGKLGGAPWRADISYEYLNQKLDMNALGFQPLSNIQWVDVITHYVRPNGIGRLRNLTVDLGVDVNWSTDARQLWRGINSWLNVNTQLPSYDSVGIRFDQQSLGYEPRELPRMDVPFERQSTLGVTIYSQTDVNRSFSAYLDAVLVCLFPVHGIPGGWGYGADATLLWRPIPALETRLDASFVDKPFGARYLETVASTAMFGWQSAGLFSATLRQQVVITPRLTFQVYAQLFTSAVRYNEFYSALIPERGTIPLNAISPAQYNGLADSHSAAFNINAVVRWEYRLGSTLYVVYTRSMRERAVPAGTGASRDVWPVDLSGGPAIDTFLIKWTYLFGV